MALHTQLYLGSAANLSELVYGALLLFTFIPMIVWLIISLLRWRTKRASFKRWAITTGILGILAIAIWTSVQVFAGVSYTAASLTQVHVPRSVVVLENDSDIGRNAARHFIVVRFKDKLQMNSFIQSATEKRWKSGRVMPSSLVRPLLQNENVMLGKKDPLPSSTRHGYFYSFSTSGKGPIKDGTFKGEQLHTVREACFLDIRSMILYIFYDDIIE